MIILFFPLKSNLRSFLSNSQPKWFFKYNKVGSLFAYKCLRKRAVACFRQKRAPISQRRTREGKKKKRLRFFAQVVTATTLPIGLDSAEKSVRKNPTLANLNSRAPGFPALLKRRSFKRGQERLVCLQGCPSVTAVYVPPALRSDFTFIST